MFTLLGHLKIAKSLVQFYVLGERLPAARSRARRGTEVPAGTRSHVGQGCGRIRFSSEIPVGYRHGLIDQVGCPVGIDDEAKGEGVAMARGPRKTPSDTDARPKVNGANVGYEAQLWQMADALRGSMDASEYKHVVLGLIFLKYISDAFEEQHAKLLAEKTSGADPEDPDEYRAQNIFWVPPEARWQHIKAQARQPTIGQLVDGAMAGIEDDNPALKGVLPKDYARPALDKQRLGQRLV
jgi:hypothetical protein